MNKLRLITTYDCPRSCEGCCNKDHPNPIPIGDGPLFSGYYDEIYLTGGEPMLYADELVKFALESRKKQYNTKIFIYSAECSILWQWLKVLPWISGITFTLHDQNEDYLDFLAFAKTLEKIKKKLQPMSLRLNTFVDLYNVDTKMLKYFGWDIREKVWLKNCPIPEGEDFRILEKPFDRRLK